MHSFVVHRASAVSSALVLAAGVLGSTPAVLDNAVGERRLA